MSDLEALIAELSQVRRLLVNPDLSWAAEDDLVRRGADLAEMICAEQRRVLEAVVGAVQRAGYRQASVAMVLSPRTPEEARARAARADDYDA